MRDLPSSPLPAVVRSAPTLTWQDEIRCLELDEAARRSLFRRRTTILEYQEANEEVGFKGTMTLVGCGLLWIILVVLILSAWLPSLVFVIPPLLVIFLGLQFLQFLTKKTPPEFP